MSKYYGQMDLSKILDEDSSSETETKKDEAASKSKLAEILPRNKKILKTTGKGILRKPFDETDKSESSKEDSDWSFFPHGYTPIERG